MEDIINETVSTEELNRFEVIYNRELREGNVTTKAQFEYACCLVRSRYAADMRKGLVLLEDLFTKDTDGRRDYLYYLSIGNARIKEYTKALKYVQSFLEVEPGNQQVLNLETIIKKKLEREGIIGMAVAGGVALAIGGIVGVAVALTKHH